MTHSDFNFYTKSTNVRPNDLATILTNRALTLGQWIFPKAVEDFVRQRFFRPVTKPLTNPQEKWIKNANPVDIVSREKKIRIWKTGTGPSILFIHGWNGRGVQFQRFFKAAIAAGFSVIFFDAPAHGESEGELTNYLEVTESINAIFNHAIGRNIVGIIGHSLGASATINHLSLHQKAVSVVLIAPALKLIELLFASFRHHGVPGRTAIRLLKEVEVEFNTRLELRNPIDLIEQLDNKLLIIHDRVDKTTPIGPSKEVANELENIEMLETEGLGHNRLLKDKHVIENAIAFLKGNYVGSTNSEHTEKVSPIIAV